MIALCGKHMAILFLLSTISAWVADATTDPSLLEMKVGKYEHLKLNPGDDEYIVGQVNLGSVTRDVNNGDFKMDPVDLDYMLNTKFVFLVNVPRMYYSGYNSEAWLLAAYDYEVIKPLEAPEGCEVGDEVWIEGYKGSSATYGSPDQTMANFYDLDMVINDNNTVVWDDHSMLCNSQEVTVEGLIARKYAYIVSK